MIFFEGNYILYYVELKCKYNSLEYRKRRVGCFSLVKKMKIGLGFDEGGKFGKVERKY